MASLVLSRANVRRVLVKLTAALDCGIDGCRATGPSHWTSNSNINRLSSHVFDIGRPFSDGRPRGPLWRSRKVVGKEALVVIQELKRIKDDSKRLESFMKTNVARLLKADLLAVLAELQRQDEVFLALKVSKGRERYRDCSLCLMKHFIFMEGVPVRKKCWVLAAGSSFIFQLRDFVSCVCTKDVRK